MNFLLSASAGRAQSCVEGTGGIGVEQASLAVECGTNGQVAQNREDLGFGPLVAKNGAH
jgi:hypothetical protein